jgi:hypothetical protein
MMEGERPPRAAPDDVRCRSCGLELPKGAGRFLLACGAVCVPCYDAGFRCPPPQADAKP